MAGHILQIAVQPPARAVQFRERLINAEFSGCHQDADRDTDLPVHFGGAARVDIVAERLSDQGQRAVSGEMAPIAAATPSNACGQVE